MLGRRALSFEFDPEMQGYNRQYAWSYQLKSEINLRMALMAGKSLHYPPRVKEYLYGEFLNCAHHVRGGVPALAFALGMRTPAAWYVFVLQSDAACAASACVREYVRGWRKILFTSIAAHARTCTDRLYLCRAEDVLRACHPGSMPGDLPQAWRTIYDGTACELSMQPVRLAEPVDLRMYRAKQEPVLSQQFYEWRLTGNAEDSQPGHGAVPCHATL